MSVINKMLRDLDARKSSAAPDSVPSATGVGSESASLAGRAAVADLSPRRGRHFGLAAGVVAVASLAAVLGWWHLEGSGRSSAGAVSTPIAQGRDSKVAVPATTMPAVSTAPAGPAPAPVAAALALPASEAVVPAAVAPVSAIAATAVPASAVPAAVESATVSAAPAPSAASVKVQRPASRGAQAATAHRETPVARTPPATPAPSNIALRMETAITARSLREPAVGRTPSVISAETPRTQGTGNAVVSTATAAQEALTQAQTLWSGGNRDAAIDLVRDAVSIAERAGVAGGAGLLPLVRELTRMQLAEGHYGAVWDLLTRLEPHLGNQADLWAIRANAAQRLGRHQDSVHAYMVALQSRPTEQRWLLGSAVSLAALGQTSSAAEMADKARAAGPVSKDVMAYLRQMNVPLRD